MARVGYVGRRRVVSFFGKTFWNVKTGGGYIEVNHPNELAFFRQRNDFEIRDSIPEKVGRAAETIVGTAGSVAGSLSDRISKHGRKIRKDEQ